MGKADFRPSVTAWGLRTPDQISPYCCSCCFVCVSVCERKREKDRTRKRERKRFAGLKLDHENGPELSDNLIKKTRPLEYFLLWVLKLHARSHFRNHVLGPTSLFQKKSKCSYNPNMFMIMNDIKSVHTCCCVHVYVSFTGAVWAPCLSFCVRVFIIQHTIFRVFVMVRSLWEPLQLLNRWKVVQYRVNPGQQWNNNVNTHTHI